MIYVKANVERIVNDLASAKKLEAEGFRLVEPKAKPKAVQAEPKEEKRLVDLIRDEKPEEIPVPDKNPEEAPAKPRRRRRSKAEE